MSSTPLVSLAIAAFVIAALLFWQMKQQRLEGFKNSPEPPVAGRPYGAVGEMNNTNFMPADLSKTPVVGGANPTTNLPASIIRPQTVPGPSTTARDPPASSTDLQELNVFLNTWLQAAAKREAEHPGSLNADVLQQRVLYEARAASVLEQLGSGNITDMASQVRLELQELKRQNEMWKRLYPNLGDLAQFGVNERQDTMLSAEQYDNFRGLFDAVMQEFREHPQTDPLYRVRFQQLQVFLQELQSAEKQYTVPPIRMRAARLFLQRAMRPDQPLPTLFALESCTPFTPLALITTDLGSVSVAPDQIADLRRNMVSHRNMGGPVPYGMDVAAVAPNSGNGPLADRLNMIRSMLPPNADTQVLDRVSDSLKDGSASAELQTAWKSLTNPGIAIPPAFIETLLIMAKAARDPQTKMELELSSARARAGMLQTTEYQFLQQQVAGMRSPTVLTSEAPKFNSKSRVQKGYDPHDMVQRAKTLCSQMKEAFPQDVGDFGCPANPKDITTELQAQNTINLVCDTIRYSVPSITPEQFNCPPPLRSGFA
jgi:hypothetical protein